MSLQRLVFFAMAALLAGGIANSSAASQNPADVAGVISDLSPTGSANYCARRDTAAIRAVPGAAILLAQARRLTPGSPLLTRPGPLTILTQVPAGQTYQIQLEGETTFTRYASGAALGVIDCAQIPCPGTFGPDVICWKCKERAEFRAPGGLLLAPQ